MLLLLSEIKKADRELKSATKEKRLLLENYRCAFLTHPAHTISTKPDRNKPIEEKTLFELNAIQL